MDTAQEARSRSLLNTLPQRGWLRGALWLPPLLARLLDVPTLRGGLVRDDPLPLNHTLYRVPINWNRALGSPFAISLHYSRPLAVARFLLTRATPWINHLRDGLFHAPNTALVILLISRLRPPGDGHGVLQLSALAGDLAYLSDHPGVALCPSR